MKYTLLQMVQNILSSMDSDEVSSINDTTESLQVAYNIRTAYYNIIARADLPEHQEPFQLTSSASVSTPVLMSRPTNTNRIDWIKYNKSENPSTEPSFEYVNLIPFQQFIDLTQILDLSETNVDSMTLGGVTYYFRNDKMPDYCTAVEDNYVVFDSYDNTVDTQYLQTSKTFCFGLSIPTFTIDDSFTPDLDEQQFPLLLNEAKSLSFVELKQISHEKAEQESRRQWRTLQRTKNLPLKKHFNDFPYFGRK